MAVHSNTFGGLRLSGEDAKKFRNQTRAVNCSESARASAVRGVEAARLMLEHGQVKVAKAT